VDEVEFDPLKDAENQQKHGLPLELAPLMFEGAFIEEEDRRSDYGETRIVATGPVELFDGRICVVVYTWRDAVRRIISFRKANDKEVRKYQASVD
jgi:uncharacterized DUF497 family protein